MWINSMQREEPYLPLTCTELARDGLVHSRYSKTDRADNESVWVTSFGKDGAKARAQQGRILVGTQVLEFECKSGWLTQGLIGWL